MEYQSTPAPQPARDPLADDFYLHERSELITKKYAAGLNPHEAQRLAEIEEYLDRHDSEKADWIDVRCQERMGRINANLDRVERAIQNLKALKLQ